MGPFLCGQRGSTVPLFTIQCQNEINMYPLKFENIFKSVVWGGEKIAPFKGVETDQHNIGESWELSGVELNRVQMKVYDLDNEAEFAEFARGEQRKLKVYGSEEEVNYDPQKRIGVAISKMGASKAISVGAYTFALDQLDK